MSYRRKRLRRCWTEFPLVRARDGRSDLLDLRPFFGVPTDSEETPREELEMRPTRSKPRATTREERE